ncbi:hypothetical protein GCM10010344_35320 [Streptomyces bluensis]|nr:hypothetical protein GCM10010344_35320 [Streptomyces bluensis]
MRAARIGPTVWELDGPMPIENRSKTETATVTPQDGWCGGPWGVPLRCERATPHGKGLRERALRERTYVENDLR